LPSCYNFLAGLIGPCLAGFQLQGMELRYYGHSCFSVAIKGKQLLFDPFISGNELAKNIIDIDSIKADYILLSHGHADHIADCLEIAGKTGAKLVCNWELHEWLNRQGISNTHPMNIGGKWNFPEFGVKCTVAQHSSSLPDGSYGGNPMGFVITSEAGNFYYSGDTGLTMDMQLIPRWATLNFAVLPIGDNFTMDTEDAIACARMINCETVVAVHFDTFGFIKIDRQKTSSLMAQAGINLQLLNIGETRLL
jgi:L-ascorbate metabolism protein UlaG (beta-lactamase superfamily)